MTYTHIVSDSTPLMHLEAQLDGFSFLRRVFEKVYIPRAVAEELAEGYGITPEEYLQMYAVTDFVEIHSLPINPGLKELENLHKGEAEAISLAYSLNLPLLIEEHKGRRIARLNQITITGNAGIVLYACKNSLCTKQEATDRLDAMLKNNNISHYVYETILNQLESSE